MDSSPLIVFRNKETAASSSRNEKVFCSEGTYKTLSGGNASYSYSITITYYQGRAWIHLQDNRQGKQISMMKEAYEGLLRCFKVEDAILEVERTGKGEAPPSPPVVTKKKKAEEEGEEDKLPKPRSVVPKKRRIHEIALLSDDEEL